MNVKYQLSHGEVHNAININGTVFPNWELRPVLSEEVTAKR